MAVQRCLATVLGKPVPVRERHLCPWVVASVRMLCGLLEKCSDTIGTMTNVGEAASPVLLSPWHGRERRGWESHCVFWVPFQQPLWCGVSEVWAGTQTRSGSENSFLTVDHRVGNRLGHPGSTHILHCVLQETLELGCVNKSCL